jgi:hypothetical protein
MNNGLKTTQTMSTTSKRGTRHNTYAGEGKSGWTLGSAKLGSTPYGV